MVKENKKENNFSVVIKDHNKDEKKNNLSNLVRVYRDCRKKSKLLTKQINVRC